MLCYVMLCYVTLRYVVRLLDVSYSFTSDSYMFTFVKSDNICWNVHAYLPVRLQDVSL